MLCALQRSRLGLFLSAAGTGRSCHLISHTCLRLFAAAVTHRQPQDPLFVPALMGHVGPVALADWMSHVGNLGAYTALNATAAPSLRALAERLPDAKQRFRLRRMLDAWEFGSGADYKL